MKIIQSINRTFQELLYNMYYICEKIPFFTNYFHKLVYINGILRPSDSYGRVLSTMRFLFLKILFSIIVLFFMIKIGGISWLQLPVITGILLLLQKHFTYMTLEKQQRKLLERLENCLNEVRHSYHACKEIEESLSEAIETTDEIMSLHLYQMRKLLEKDADVEQYREIAPNRFFVTFYALCKAVIEYGDTDTEEGSVFLMNLNYLKKEIMIELLKREKLNYIFSGSFLVMILPICFLRQMEQWGISNIPELKDFYFGGNGLIVRILLYFITGLTYLILEGLKEQDMPVPKEHRILEKISKWYSVAWILQQWKEKREKHCNEITETLRKLKPEMTLEEFMVQRVVLLFAAFFSGGFLQFQIGITVKGILIIVIFALILSFFPYFILSFQQIFLKNAMEEEIIQLQTIILMLVKMEQMDAETVLQWLERFSIIFHPSIAACVDEYYYREEEALEKLREKEPFQAFGRIVEDLQACDQTGVEYAFEDIISQQAYFMDKRQQDNEISLSKREAFVRIAAFIPMVSTIGLYLIIPFLYQSFSTLLYYLKEIQTL